MFISPSFDNTNIIYFLQNKAYFIEELKYNEPSLSVGVP
jgi:hypothetical protein